MKFGVMVPHWGESSSPEAILKVAQEAETLGFDSLWLGDHVSVPLADDTAARDRFYEMVTTLGYLVGVTSRIKLGTGVMILPYRHPVFVASAVATAHELSGGRIIFGGASGWMKLEFSALGVPFKARGARTDEYIEVIKHLWTNPRPQSFHGSYVDFDNIKFSPELYPGEIPPMWIGGNSRAAASRAVDMGDAWFPLHLSVGNFERRLAYLFELCEQRGREGSPLVAMGSSIDFSPADGVAQAGFQGAVPEVFELIGCYRDLGLDYLILDFPRQSLEKFIESLAQFAEQVIPAFRS